MDDKVQQQVLERRAQEGEGGADELAKHTLGAEGIPSVPGTLTDVVEGPVAAAASAVSEAASVAKNAVYGGDAKKDST